MALNEASQGIGYGEFVGAETPYPPAELTAILLPYDSAAPGFFLKTAVYVPFVPFGHELMPFFVYDLQSPDSHVSEIANHFVPFGDLACDVNLPAFSDQGRAVVMQAYPDDH